MPAQADAADQTGVRTRPFSLVRYLLIVFGLSWPFQFACVMLAQNLLTLYVLNAVSMVMVAVATFIAGRYIFRDGFAGVGWRWGTPRAYLAVAGLLFALWLLPTAIEGALGRLKPLSGLSSRQIGWGLTLIFGTLIPAFGEEFGWRGYMLPRMACSLGLRKAIMMHALIWWMWHLPILIGGEVRAGMLEAEVHGLRAGLTIALQLTPSVLIGLLPALLHAVVMAAVWAQSRSLAVATVYHAGYDGIRDTLQITVGLGSITVLWASLLLLVLGAALLWKGDWQGLTEACRQATAREPGAPPDR